MWEKQPWRHQGQQRREMRFSRCQSRDFPCGSWWKTTVKQIALEDHDGADIHTPTEAAAPRKPTSEQAPGRICGPRREAHARAGFLEQSVPEGLYPVERTHAVAGEECEEEGVAKNPLHTENILNSSSPWAADGQVEELGMKQCSWAWEEGGWWEGVFSFVFISHCPTLLLISNILNWFPQVESVLPVMVVGGCLVLLRKGSEGAAWWAPDSQLRLTHYIYSLPSPLCEK